MIAGVVLTGLALVALGLAVLASDAHARARRRAADAKADREAAERIHAATAEHVREAVLRKPFDVGERPRGCESPAGLAMLINENGRIVPLPIPQGSHPVFGRVPRGVS